MITDIEKEQLYEEFKNRMNEEKRNAKSRNYFDRARRYHIENRGSLAGWDHINAITREAFGVRYNRNMPDSKKEEANDFAILISKCYIEQLKKTES